MSPYWGLPEALLAADFWQVLQYEQSFEGSFVHWVCNPLLNRTPLHQLSSISPQKGNVISGLQRPVVLLDFSLLFWLALTFFIATERLLAIVTSSKLNIRIALSTEHVNTPSFESSSITPFAKFTDAKRIPFSTAALITICILDIFNF